MALFRAARAIAGKIMGKIVRDTILPYAAALLAVLFAHSGAVAVFMAVVGVGMGTGDTLQMYGVSTGWSIVAALPAGALAGWAAQLLWWHEFDGSSRSMSDVFGEWADQVVTVLNGQSGGGRS